ncbi:MAG TPA: VWA domain-containing protein, partial [Thermoanaerobaculia bacterium]
MRLFTVAACVAAGLAGFASAQNVGPLPPLTAQVEVHVVNVDATVTDAKGNPVVDLTKDDFEIFEDGVPQKVTNFSIFRTAGTPAPAVAAEGRSASTQRRILLIIDNNYLGIVERNQALDIVEKYLNDSFSGEWAVAAISRHLEMLQSFTSDKALIRGALGKARKMPSSEIQHQIDRSVLSERFIKKEDFMVPVDYREKVAF